MTILKDATALRKHLERTYDQNHQPLEIDDVPSGIKTFWREIGWGPFMERRGLAQPGRESSL